MADPRDLIPHREPFLFVDRIVETTETSITAERTLRPDEPYFAGHYPGEPLMPGVLICEAVFQTGAAFIAGSTAGQVEGKPVLTRIKEAKFKNMARPGDTLVIEVTLDEKMGDAYLMTGRVTCEGKTILRVSFIVAVV